MTIQQRRPAPGLIVHSDRGSQYASKQYRALLSGQEFICSMSRRANCWDNALGQRLFLNLKMKRVWQRTYANQAEAKNDVVDYIIGFYNCTRLHSVLGNLSPSVFERNISVNKPIAVSECTWLLQWLSDSSFPPPNTNSSLSISLEGSPVFSLKLVARLILNFSYYVTPVSANNPDAHMVD
jgi:hypothetical protein